LTAAGAGGPSRITVAGDWHGNTARAREAVRHVAASGVGLLLHLGDLGIAPGGAGERFLDGLETELARAGVELWFIDGNHDDHRRLGTLPREVDGSARISDHIRYLPRAHRWIWEGQTWLALGGAYSVGNSRYTAGVDWWPEETIADADVAAAAAGGPVDTVIAHDAPLGVDVPGYVGHPAGWSDADLAAANANRARLRTVLDAVTPARLFHGHYHVRYDATLARGRGTRITGLADDGSPLADNLLPLALPH
jgi:hypothetical protein